MDVGPTFYWEFPYFGMATGLPVLFCKTVVPVLDSAVLIRPAGTGDSGLRLCGAHRKGPLTGEKIDFEWRRPPFAEAGGNPWPICPRAGHWGVEDYPWAQTSMDSVVCVYGHSTEKGKN